MEKCKSCKYYSKLANECCNENIPCDFAYGIAIRFTQPNCNYYEQSRESKINEGIQKDKLEKARLRIEEEEKEYAKMMEDKGVLESSITAQIKEFIRNHPKIANEYSLNVFIKASYYACPDNCTSGVMFTKVNVNSDIK